MSERPTYRSTMKCPLSCLVGWVLLAPVLHAVDLPQPPESRETRTIEGWSVHIDKRLLDDEEGRRAVRLLESRLADLSLLLPADKLAKLREVPIWIDESYGSARGMCYHPNPKWLEEHGYEVALAKGVHIQRAANFASKHHQSIQPWSVLHELAHAYHDRVLGFGEARILDAWKRFKREGKYDECRHIHRRGIRHYGLTDQKEFFAEMTEAYFGRNDFEPFTRAELKDREPWIHDLMEQVWRGE